MLKVTILQNFATIGIPDFDVELGKNWSIVALSKQLIDENRLKGLQQLNTRRLDLVIHNGRKIALLNLQAFKIFQCPLASNMIQQCLTHHLTSNGNLFGVQPSGDVIILTGGLQAIKHVKRPAYAKIQPNSMKWFDILPIRLLKYFSGSGRNSESKSNQVAPSRPLTTNSSSWWPFQSSPSLSDRTPHDEGQALENLQSQFPYITALPDGLALLCVYSPVSCYVFVSSYETALRSKSISNLKGSHVPGKWHRIIMQKDYIVQWLEERKCVQWFEAKLCYSDSHEQEETGHKGIGGAMLYAVQKGLGVEIAYGLIKRQGEKFTMHWEKVEYEVDWVLKEPSVLCNLESGSSFVARLSADCMKMAVVISTNLGMHTWIQDLPVTTDSPVIIQRSSCALCNHSDYDGAHFYRQDCWISDIQWLVEDVYIAIMTMCGSLSIFYANSGEPMVLKVRRPGAESDESKSARFFFPVFHPHQICSAEKASQEETDGRSGATWERNKASLYPTMKWLDAEKVLTCSSGMKIELFFIQQVINLPKEKQDLSIEDNDKVKLAEKIRSDAVIASSSRGTGISQVTTKADPEKFLSNYFPPRYARTNRDRSIYCEDLPTPSYRPRTADSELLLTRPVSVYSHNNNIVKQSPVTEYGLMSDNINCYTAEDEYDMDNNMDEMSTS